MSPVFSHGALRLYLLKLLDEQPRHGYELMKELEDRFLGLYTPSAGTIYPRLARLEADGLVAAEADGEGRRRFRLTDAGRGELRDRASELDEVEAEVAGSAREIAREVRDDVRASVRELRAELKQATKEVRADTRRARSGGPARSRNELRILQRELRRFVADVMGSAAARGLDPAALESIVGSLARARADVAAALAPAD